MGRKRGSCQQPAQTRNALPLSARSWVIWPGSSTGRSHKTKDYRRTSARPMTSQASKILPTQSASGGQLRRPPGRLPRGPKGSEGHSTTCPAVQQWAALISSSCSVAHSEPGVARACFLHCHVGPCEWMTVAGTSGELQSFSGVEPFEAVGPTTEKRPTSHAWKAGWSIIGDPG